jgi:MinD superfamily P-loop ATPase
MKKTAKKESTLKSKTITIKTNEENPEPLELIAKSIIDIAQGFERLKSSKLKQRVIVLLIRDKTGVSITDIERVLDVASDLKKHFIK